MADLAKLLSVPIPAEDEQWVAEVFAHQMSQIRLLEVAGPPEPEPELLQEFSALWDE